MWSILIRIGGGDLLTLSSRFVWLGLVAIFVLSGTLSFFVTLGLGTESSTASAPDPTTTTSVQAETSNPKPSPTPTRTGKVRFAGNAQMEILQIGSAEAWGFYNPSNQGGVITIDLDSKNDVDTAIIRASCYYMVDSKGVPCPGEDANPVLSGGAWSRTVPFVIDMSRSQNLSPKTLILGFETVNEKGTFPVELRFTFGGWK